MSGEVPIACPICLDAAVERIEGTRLSATINGAASAIHRVFAFRCSNWHVFAVMAPQDSAPQELIAPSGRDEVSSLIQRD